MEVLPCSSEHYVKDSDCPQQGSGKAFMCTGESNCFEQGEQVQGSDAKVNDLLINAEGPQEERHGESQWTPNKLPNSEVQGNGASYFDIEVEGQKYSSDSVDFEYENLNGQDFCTESLLASETAHVIMDTNDSGLSNYNKDGESSLSETRWLEHDESVAVWVKWRGKWQAGIRCARADWPLSTVKAKPTHDRKNYLVIFFPRTRNYSWADVLLLRPIHEFPEPIAYRTHKVGVKMVKDLTLARRFIMQKLAVGMVNMIDRLQPKALVETACNAMVWKDFAREASSCKGYADLGRMLLKLQNMILQCFINSDWLQYSLHSWTQQCHNVNSAESVEMLKEELFDSILWDEVNLLFDTSVQPELVSEWKNWKNEVMKWFSTSHPSPSSGGYVMHPTNDSPISTGFQLSRKRPKLEVRRAESHSSQFDSHISNQASIVEIDAGFFDGRGIGNVSTLEQIQSEDTAIKESPVSVADRWGEIVVEAGNSEFSHTENRDTTLANGGEGKKSFEFGNKNRQCQAFIEAKGRQCVRWANDGDVYCCVHLASHFVGNTAKAAKAEVSPPVDVQMCSGTTVLGTKCKHRSLCGSSFCKKHRPYTDINPIVPFPDNNLKRNHDAIMNKSNTTNCKDIVLVGNVEAPLKVDPLSVVCNAPSNGTSSIKYGDIEVKHCIGLCTPEANDYCLESPNKLSLYCEKHLPSWLKRARNGKSRIISKEVFLELLKDCYSLEQKIHLHQACDLFYRLFKSILSLRNPVPKEVQFKWALSEASKDVRIGELLMKLVCSELDRLRRLWGFDADKDTQHSSSIKELVPVPEVSSEHSVENTVRCKICSEQFVDEQALGGHWMDNHKKEAQWLFRGYVCAICLDSFTNKKGLETHVQDRHHVQFVEQCMLLQCIPCGGHFGNPDQLWLHVLSIHACNLRLLESGQQHDLSVGQDSVPKLEQDNSASVDKKNSDGQGGFRRFICKFCGLKFDLLPDLGRHHQAAHMGATSIGPRPPKKGIRFYAYRLKSGRLTRPSFRKGLGSTSYRIRNRATSIKKRILATSAVGSSEMKVQSPVAEAGALGRLEESQCSSVAKTLFSEIQKTKPRPSNLEILSVARSACCKVSLQVLLEEKYGILPERLYLKAAKLCSEHNIMVDWHKETYICPKGCNPMNDTPLASSLMTLTQDFAGQRSKNPEDPTKNEWEMDECHCVIDSRHFKHDSVPKTFILCDDISFGQESVPIICVVDENLLDSIKIARDCSDDKITAYTMPWEGFTYAMKPLLDRSLRVEMQGLQLGCVCTNSTTCSPETCDHVYLFDNDYEDAKDIYGKPMLGRFPYDENGRLILEAGYLVYECNHTCSCNRSCRNRVLQNGVQVKLEVFKTEKKGWAVRAREAILRGTFVCEFIGEVIDEREAYKRHNSNGRQSLEYFYNVDAHISDMRRLVEETVPYIIDSMSYGNLSRYLNHSCSPNLVSRQVLVEGMDCQLARIGFFASQDIAAGEELTYDYCNKLLPGEGHPCYCGASNCRGRLY